MVVGIGNDIRGDDGIGLLVAQQMRSILPSSYTVKELHSAGFNLLEAVRGFKKAYIIDAVKTAGGIPGTVYRYSAQEFRESLAISSFHELDVNHLVAFGEQMTGEAMPEITVLAIEVLNLNEFSETLSPELEKQFDRIVEKVKNAILTKPACHCEESAKGG